MVAPLAFMFKNNIYYLEWLHFWGASNATKSNTGIIILSVDGHHKDTNFIRNISNIDTVAKLGDEMGKTTFPKLFDEANLKDDKYNHLPNQIKSAVSSKIVRSKLRPNGSRIEIPALTPAILTSNPPPPLYDSAYMKRVIDRYFDKSESKIETDPQAVEFRRFLVTELDKVYHLGDFRNWYVMNHQDLILSLVNAGQIPLLEIGMQLLVAAYEYAGLPMPEWYSRRLPHNQLQDSIVDNKSAIKNLRV
jgi:hypothetical protein